MDQNYGGEKFAEGVRLGEERGEGERRVEGEAGRGESGRGEGRGGKGTAAGEGDGGKKKGVNECLWEAEGGGWEGRGE